MMSKLIGLKRRYSNRSISNVQHILYSGMLESMTIYKTYCSTVRRPKLTFTLHCFMMSKLIRLKKRYSNWSSWNVQHILYSGTPESSPSATSSGPSSASSSSSPWWRTRQTSRSPTAAAEKLACFRPLNFFQSSLV